MLACLVALATAPGLALGVDLSQYQDALFQRQALNVAREALESWVLHGRPPALRPPMHPLLLRQAGVFVSLELAAARAAPGNGAATARKVRGCRGTLEPRYTRLVDELVANMREAALRDPLHRPIRPSELGRIRIVLCIPGQAEPISESDDFDARHYGLVVESGERAAAMLPWEAPDALHMRLWGMKRAHIREGDPVRLLRFPAVRFAEPAR